MTFADMLMIVKDCGGDETFTDAKLDFHELEFPNHELRQAFIAKVIDAGFHLDWVYDTAGMRINCVYVYPHREVEYS